MDCRKNHCLDAQQQEVLQRLRKKNGKLKGVHVNYKHKKIGKENLTQTASKTSDKLRKLRTKCGQISDTQSKIYLE